MTCALWTSVVPAFRRLALPLASYYAVTLALPLANGAARSGAAFVKHAIVVLVVPPLAIMLACAVRLICARMRQRLATRASRSGSLG